MRLLATLLCMLAFAAPALAGAFAIADRPREFSFPRDHASHPEFATEWWYFTGALSDESGRRFGYELTFFRVALTDSVAADASSWRARDLLLAHVALTDVQGKRFRSQERIRRALPDVALASPERLDLQAGNWSARQHSESIELEAGEAALGLRLSLLPARPPLLHGESGLSYKDSARENASYYYSIPRLSTRGTLMLDGERYVVEGDSWMDHEFFSGDTPADGLGWDWFSFHLEDGSDLMLYRVRHPQHGELAFGSLMDASGKARALDVSAASWSELSAWSSPTTGTRYPTAWEIQLPKEGLSLRTHPLLEEQEIDSRRSVGFAYWEGLSEAKLDWAGKQLSGIGYVELTGYATSSR